MQKGPHESDLPSGSATERVLIEQAGRGDEKALAQLFEAYRPRLRTMVDIRMDHRVRGRVDASDVLQEAFVDLAQKLPGYADKDLPFYLWLRLVTGERLLQVHRRHLDAEMRSVAREVRLAREAFPQTDTVSLVAHLEASNTPASGRLRSQEQQDQMISVIDAMEPMDREILVLRHFEELTNQETAQVLGISKTAASNRYVRAVTRLREGMGDAGISRP